MVYRRVRNSINGGERKSLLGDILRMVGFGLIFSQEIFFFGQIILHGTQSNAGVQNGEVYFFVQCIQPRYEI